MTGTLYQRRVVWPVVAMNRALVAVIEQGAHEPLIERRRQLFGKLGADIGQVETDPVTLRVLVHSLDVVIAADRDHGGDRAPRDTQRTPFHLGPLRIQPAVTDDICNGWNCTYLPSFPDPL